MDFFKVRKCHIWSRALEKRHIRILKSIAICIACLQFTLASDVSLESRDRQTTRVLELPARYMWGWGPGLSGFCGSVTIQTAALYYGNWLTEYAVRGTSGGYDAQHELLIAFPTDLSIPSTSMLSACDALKLNCNIWDYHTASNPQHSAFIRWADAGIRQGHPVALGLYWGVENDPDYDHIVPMVGFDYDAGGEPAAIYYNDLHTNKTLREELSTFVRSRDKCRNSQPFGLGSFCLPKKVNYGMQVLGNADPVGELLPVRLHVNRVDEPDYSLKGRRRQVPVLMRARLVVQNLTPGQRYALLRYEEAAKVPVKDFLNAPATDRHVFTATSSEYAREVTFMSDSTTFFRCVRMPAAAPSEPIAMAAKPTTVVLIGDSMAEFAGKTLDKYCLPVVSTNKGISGTTARQVCSK